MYTARFRTKYSVPCTASSAPFRGADPPRAEQRYAAGERFDWGSTRAALKITSVEGWSALAILINPAARSTGIFPVQTIFKRPTDYTRVAAEPASQREEHQQPYSTTAATQCIIHLALELEPFLGSVITPALPQEGFSLSCHSRRRARLVTPILYVMTLMVCLLFKESLRRAPERESVLSRRLRVIYALA